MNLKFLKNLSKYTYITISLMLFGTICSYIFYHFTKGNNSSFASDIPTHLQFVNFIMKGEILYIPHPGLHFIIIIISWITFSSTEFSIVIVLTLFSIWAFYLTYHYLFSFFNNSSENSILITIILFLISSIYIPVFSPNIYLGQGSPNIWHNPTYIVLKPLAMVSFFLFYKLWYFEIKKLNIKYFYLSIFLLLTVWIKPNFAITFISLVVIFFLYYVFIKKVKTIIALKYLVFLMPTIISLLIQYYISYIFKDGRIESSIIFSVLNVWKIYSPNPYFSCLLGIGFPLATLSFRFHNLKYKDLFNLTITFYILSLLQMAFLAESGANFTAWNFSWSYNLALYFLFFYSLLEFFEWYRNLNLKNALNLSKFCITSTLLLLHIISGIIYLNRILLGYSYY